MRSLGRWIVALTACAALLLVGGPVLAGDDGNGKKTGHSKRSDASNNRDGSRPDQDGRGMDRGVVNEDKTGPGADWNNGCGNDADREDDNNGWCGQKPDGSVQAERTFAVESRIAAFESSNDTAVLGSRFTRTAAVTAPAVEAVAAPFVTQPIEESSGVAGAIVSGLGSLLASTGARIAMLIAAAAALLWGGTWLVHARRSGMS